MKSLPTISWPTAIVLVAFTLAWVAMAWLKVPVPMWMLAFGAVLGKLIVASMPSLFGSGSSNSNTPSTDG